MLDKLLQRYIFDPDNEDSNYDLGLYYELIGQTASAVSFYLRCAERSKSLEVQYECLLKAGACFESQGKRNFTVKGLYQHAISILPSRPEAYYLLARFYEKEDADGSWHDSYMIASIGEKTADSNPQPLRNSVDYPGFYAITFQKAVAAWWCGLCEESRDLFLELDKNPDLEESFRSAVDYNINHLNIKREKTTNTMNTNIYYQDNRPTEEWGHITTNRFHINKNIDKRVFVVDNFYENPDEVRQFALSQSFHDDEGYLGMRTRKQFFFDGVKERFETIIGEKINDWETEDMNGRFQTCKAGVPLVYHCDAQKWAGIVYLTPNAPVNCGTSFYMHKETKRHHNSQIDWDAGEGNKVFNQHTFLDRTPYEMVDTVGNIYNRLVIFDGGLIHAATEYFGWDIPSSRLFHMYFFN